jgi:cobalamin biosynthesis Mg chelatase CobN
LVRSLLPWKLVMCAGALKKAAENARKDGKPVGCSIVETFGKDAAPQELSDVLRLEYRSKLLNPKWAKVSKPFPPIL